MGLRIVQITDLHLFRERDGRLAGVATWDTLREVLDHVRRHNGNFDYLILTGDLAQDEAPETYLMLREALAEWRDRCRIIPGNHDDRTSIRATFPESVPGGDGPLTFVLLEAGWQIIGLDSHLPGQVNGRVDRGQLDWLRHRLADNPDTPTLLFVHHPPVPINVAWIDALGLDAADDLVGMIEANAQVKVVCAGHVHQAYSGRIGGAAFCTTPSTCIQFAARAERAFDTAAAGYRTFTLDAGGHETRVHRLSEKGG